MANADGLGVVRKAIDNGGHGLQETAPASEPTVTGRDVGAVCSCAANFRRDSPAYSGRCFRPESSMMGRVVLRPWICHTRRGLRRCKLQRPGTSALQIAALIGREAHSRQSQPAVRKQVTVQPAPWHQLCGRRRAMKNRSIVAVIFTVVLGALALTGCRTTEGVGRDLERAGEEIQEEANR